MIEYSMVMVIWEDAITSAEPGWTTKEDALTLAEADLPCMTSIGFVLFENNDWISITDSVGEDEFGQVTKIPKSLCLSIVRLGDRKLEEKDDEEDSIPII
tara:strand:- start:19 stop:318 length:300 start_codon:yes stop_codon:yes gene_type:complete